MRVGLRDRDECMCIEFAFYPNSQDQSNTHVWIQQAVLHKLPN